MLEAPKRAVKFAANDFWGKTYKSLTGQEKMTQSLSVLTGCSAVLPSRLSSFPFELVKIRLQDKAQAHLYTGPMDVVRKIIQADGLLDCTLVWNRRSGDTFCGTADTLA